MAVRRMLTGAPRVLVAVATAVAAGCGAAAPPPAPSAAPAAPADVLQLRPEVLAELPHDTSAFTQGLEIADGVLYEGTGLAGRSQLRELDPATGALRRAVDLPGELFGEGITVVDDRIWQLTWQDGVALEWDRAGLRLLRQVPLTGEGWGLCLLDEPGLMDEPGLPGGPDGGRLVRSDGTATLRFHDPATFAETGSVAVALGGAPLTALNELECVDGEVWANVWRTDRIVRIDPADGRVTAEVDASGLLDPERRVGTDVLNGIAAVPGTDGAREYLLTGKFWPAMFRVRFVPAA